MSHTPTTAAIVSCVNPRFTDINGVTGELGDVVVFSRNALLAAKQTAVRLKVNQLLASYEPGLPAALTNANIQIVGLPV